MCTENKSLNALALDDTEWLCQNWNHPAVGLALLNQIKKVARTDVDSHLFTIVTNLWEASLHPMYKTALLGFNGEANHDDWIRNKRIQQNVKIIRENLPPTISLYSLSEEERYVLMPTLHDDESTILPEDRLELLGLVLPEEVARLATWINSKKAENSIDGNGPRLVGRACKKAIKLANYLLFEKFGKRPTAKTIAKKLGWDSVEDVCCYTDTVCEVLSRYPGETKFTIIVNKKRDFNKSTFAIVEEIKA